MHSLPNSPPKFTEHFFLFVKLAHPVSLPRMWLQCLNVIPIKGEGLQCSELPSLTVKECVSRRLSVAV